MATTQPCIYKTITLAAGEDFSLPGDAEVLYVSDPASVTYSCGDLPITETTCWTFNVPLPGADVDGSLEFWVTGFQLDNMQININRNYANYGSLGTTVGSNNSETPSGYVQRLCSNIWYQLSGVTNGGTILGMTVAYCDADSSGGDLVSIIVHVPDVFTDVRLLMVDTNTQNVPFQVEGTKGECDPPPCTTPVSYTRGVMASS